MFLLGILVLMIATQMISVRKKGIVVTRNRVNGDEDSRMWAITFIEQADFLIRCMRSPIFAIQRVGQ